jgi:hypothetical protein
MFRNSEFRNRNSDLSMFQQRNSKKKTDRNLWNRKQNLNSASDDGGPRNRSQKSEFPTKSAVASAITSAISQAAEGTAKATAEAMDEATAGASAWLRRRPRQCQSRWPMRRPR